MSKKYAGASTIYGLTHIVKTDRLPMKLLWTLSTILSLLFGMYIIINNISDYLKYDVFTQTKRIVTKSNTMPSVTFCSNTPNLRPLFSQADFVETTGSTKLRGHAFYESNLAYDGFPYYHCIQFNNFNEFYSHKDTDPEIFRFKVKLGNVTYMDVFLTDYYTNVLHWPQFIAGFGNNARGDFYIDLSKSIEVKLEEPYNDCQLLADKTYRHVNCIAQCENNQSISKYNCTMGNYYSVSGYNVCAKDLVSKSEFDLVCRKQCPQECHETKFKAVVSNIHSKHHSNDTVLLDFFYSDTSYIEVSQMPKMNGFSLISNIGGALGLFIGLRFLSWIELLEYLTEIFFILKNKK